MEHINTFIINTFISGLEGSSEENLDALKSHLKQSGVNFKDYEDIGLLLLFNDFNKTNKNSLEKERYISVEDAELLNAFFEKVQKDLGNKK